MNLEVTKLLNILVSVIVPVYNVENYLEECLRSITNQSYKALEIILIDDGSTDSSGDICDAFALEDVRIKVYHVKNGGASNARNLGLREATGEFCYFCDSDDYLTVNAVNDLVNFSLSNNLDFAFFDASIIGEVANSGYRADYYQRSSNYLVGNSLTILRELLSKNEFRASVPLLFMRKRVLNKDSHDFHSGIKYEDELFTAILFLNSYRAGHLHNGLYFRRVRSDSVMTSEKSLFDFESMHTVVAELLRYFDSNKTSGSERLMLCFNIAASHFESLQSIYCKLPRHERRRANVSMSKLQSSMVYRETIITGRSKLVTKLKYSKAGKKIIGLIRKRWIA